MFFSGGKKDCPITRWEKRVSIGSFAEVIWTSAQAVGHFSSPNGLVVFVTAANVRGTLVQDDLSSVRVVLNTCGGVMASAVLFILGNIG